MSYDISRDGDYIVLMRCEGPFGVPAAQWKLSVQDAEDIVKMLGNGIKSMKQRERNLKLEAEFAREPQRSIVNDALIEIGSRSDYCNHEWRTFEMNNAASPLDPPQIYLWTKCIRCGCSQSDAAEKQP